MKGAMMPVSLKTNQRFPVHSTRLMKPKALEKRRCDKMMIVLDNAGLPIKIFTNFDSIQFHSIQFNDMVLSDNLVYYVNMT